MTIHYLFLFAAFLFLNVNGDCVSPGVENPNENLCLWPVGNRRFTFASGEAYCQQGFSGNILRIDNIFINAMASTLSQVYFNETTSPWVGAQKVNGNWQYTDGTPVPYQNWAQGEPKNNSNCATVDADSGKWFSRDCDNQTVLICGFPINQTGISTVPPMNVTTQMIKNPTTTAGSFMYPSADNILFLFDVESLRNNAYIEDLKATLEGLMRNWTNFERVAIATYTDRYYEKVYYGDIQSYRDALTWIDGIKLQSNSPDITSAFRRAPLSFQLTTTYTGKQKTVLIARTADGDDVARARPFAQDLQAMGKVIVVSVEFDVSNLAVLASDDAAFEWNDPMSPYLLIDFLNAQLSQ